MAPLTEKGRQAVAPPLQRQHSDEKQQPVAIASSSQSTPPAEAEQQSRVGNSNTPVQQTEPKSPQGEKSKPELVSCYRSAGSISVPRRTTNPNHLQLVPKLPDGDTSAKDEMRQRLRLGYTKVKAANRFKKAVASQKKPEDKSTTANATAKVQPNCDKREEAKPIVKVEAPPAQKVESVPQEPAEPKKLPTLKEQTAGFVVRRKNNALARPSLPLRPVPEVNHFPRLPGLKFAHDEETATDAITAEELLKTVMSDLYGVVELKEETSDSAETIGKATMPIIHLCHPEESESPEARSPAPGPEEDRKLRMLREQMNQRRELREMRKTSREEFSSRRSSSVSSWRSEVSEEERQLEAREKEEMRQRRRSERSCKKHSKCHCYLFSIDTVGFYAVTN